MEFFDLSTAKIGEEYSPLNFHDRELDEELQYKRMGMLTSSQFGKLVVRTRDKKGFKLSESETATKLIYRIAWERLLKEGSISTGLGRVNFSSASTNHGHDYEQEAIIKYMEQTGNNVDYHQKFIERGNYVGGTPDGYVGKDGLIEVKCPWDGGNHIRSLLTGQIYNTDHLFQIQGYLWLTRRKWCDYITYDPDIREDIQLNVIRVQRDEEIIHGIQQVMNEAKKKIQQIMRSRRLK